jgi:hypothetical protein
VAQVVDAKLQLVALLRLLRRQRHHAGLSHRAALGHQT